MTVWFYLTGLTAKTGKIGVKNVPVYASKQAGLNVKSHELRLGRPGYVSVKQEDTGFQWAYPSNRKFPLDSCLITSYLFIKR
jgi:hypothetical protein